MNIFISNLESDQLIGLYFFVPAKQDGYIIDLNLKIFLSFLYNTKLYCYVIFYYLLTNHFSTST